MARHLGRDQESELPADRRPNRHPVAQLRSDDRRRRPGAARHLRDQSGRPDQSDGSARQRHRPRRHRTAAQSESSQVRCRAPRPGVPSEMDRGRSYPDPIAGP
ncbi:hypothetical protein COLO4_00964, partial [Corchorus olitorius]